MSHLHIKPNASRGKIFDVTPQNAGWGYVGFALHRLRVGDKVAEHTGD